MIEFARIIITILLLPFFLILMVIVSLILMHEVFWHSGKREVKTEGPDKI